MYTYLGCTAVPIQVLPGHGQSIYFADEGHGTQECWASAFRIGCRG